MSSFTSCDIHDFYSNRELNPGEIKTPNRFFEKLYRSNNADNSYPSQGVNVADD